MPPGIPVIFGRFKNVALRVARLVVEQGGDIEIAGTVLDLSDTRSDGASFGRRASATYDFAVDGGAISAIPLGVTLPDNAIVRGGYVDVLTTLTSATDAATGALKVQGANDLVSAIAISNGANPWDAGVAHALVPVGTAATAIKLTAARELTFTIAVEAVTAGKFVLYVDYDLGD